MQKYTHTLQNGQKGKYSEDLEACWCGKEDVQLYSLILLFQEPLPCLRMP